MDAVAKTNSLERKDIPVHELKPNALNPNKMAGREFDLLVDNINKVGITDPVLVRPIADGLYRIVGGHHRYQAAKYLGFETVPCTVITDDSFDDEQEEFQMLRHNIIHGQLDPTAFANLYYKYAGKYSDEVLQECFGFADEDEFKNLIATAAKSLPKEMQKKFKEAAKEVKTIDDLAKLLNHMFTKYGSTLPYGYMVVDYGGKQSIWLRIDSKTLKAFDGISTICIENSRTVDDIVGNILQLIAKGDLKEAVDTAIANSPVVVLPDTLQVMPTKENLETLQAL